MTMLAHTVDVLQTANSAASIILAAGDGTDDVDNEGGENSKAGPLGLAIILLLCVASYFLFRSMSRRLRNVRDNFPVNPPSPAGRSGRPAVQPGPDFDAEGTAADRAAARSAAEEPVQRITSMPEQRPPD
jgi:hypothetical protein